MDFLQKIHFLMFKLGLYQNETKFIKRLFSYSWRYKWSFLISIFGFILFASADIAPVEWIRQIIGFINDNSEDKQQLLALSLIGIALARGLGFFIGNYFMARVGFGVVYHLRDELFKKLHQLPKNILIKISLVN